MKKYLGLFTALILFSVLHEGTHAVLAVVFDEYRSFSVKPYGLEVNYKTPVSERAGIKWGFISGTSNVVTLLSGYCFFRFRAKVGSLRSRFLRDTGFYATIILMLGDPFNLSVGPFIYGGDIGGLVVGFGINRFIIQGVFFLILILSRELIAQRFLPIYGVKTKHPFFHPWLKHT